MSSFSEARTGCDTPSFGAFVVSLDFELHWGVRDRVNDQSPYVENLLGARRAIPHLLALFEEFDIAATWATVGFLFAESKDELCTFFPAIRPLYTNQKVNPYRQRCGRNEEEDPLHYAPSLISYIRNSCRQEIGCHTFSHYYCLEPGQSEAAFRADLASAVGLAMKRGIGLRSLVFPRNQIEPNYLRALPELGFTNYRGAESGWMFNSKPHKRNSFLRRTARFADHYVPLLDKSLVDWSWIMDSPHVTNVRGSQFLRPYSPRLRSLDPLRLKCVTSRIEMAARTGQVFHLWWHPHNFGRFMTENLTFLRSVLQVVSNCRARYGLKSLSMSEAAQVASSRRSEITIAAAAIHR